MKRPLPLTLLLLAAALLGAVGLIQTLLSFQRIAKGAWDGATTMQISLFIGQFVISAALAVWILWLVITKRGLVRWVGMAYIGYIALIRLYTILFVAPGQGPLSAFRGEYHNPEFGFAVERAFSLVFVAVLFWWAYTIAFSKRVKAYLSQRGADRTDT